MSLLPDPSWVFLAICLAAWAQEPARGLGWLGTTNITGHLLNDRIKHLYDVSPPVTSICGLLVSGGIKVVTRTPKADTKFQQTLEWEGIYRHGANNSIELK